MKVRGLCGIRRALEYLKESGRHHRFDERYWPHCTALLRNLEFSDIIVGTWWPYLENRSTPSLFLYSGQLRQAGVVLNTLGSLKFTTLAVMFDNFFRFERPINNGRETSKVEHSSVHKTPGKSILHLHSSL